VVPYDVSHLISDFWDCREGHRRHRGLDLAGVGVNAGLGTPVVSIGRALVLSVGVPEEDPARYGRRLTTPQTVIRGGEVLPTEGDVPDYGRVRFFTRDYGSAHTGVIVVTQILDGPLAGYTVRYMHLGDPHPGVGPGVILERGQELGVMGGTAVLSSTPHVHIDAEDPEGRRVDLSVYFGLAFRSGEDAPEC
jgi:hypothetical protein